LDGPANEEALTNLQIPAPVNFPSCCRTKNSVSRRVIRVLSKDNGAAQSESFSHFSFLSLFSSTRGVE